MAQTNINTLKRLMLDALEKSLGVVTTACRSAGISRSTHYKWIDEDEEYKKNYESVKDIAIDFAESQLHKQISKGNAVSTIFFLKTQGKKRGYVERQEISGVSDAPFTILLTEKPEENI